MTALATRARMERYTVTLIHDGPGITQPIIIVPFSPSALAAAFGDELRKRASRQGVIITASTHDVKLLLSSANGPLLDLEDPASEKIFAIFTIKAELHDPVAPEPSNTVIGDTIKIRVITAATAKQDRATLPLLSISVAATIEELNEEVARHLKLDHGCEEHGISDECNCNFSTKLCNASGKSAKGYVVFDKNMVEELLLSDLNRTGIEIALQKRFGTDVQSRKKVHFHGGEVDTAGLYSELPVVAVCSKTGHVPAHARVSALLDESRLEKKRVLDLHTSEIPINAASMAVPIKESGILALSEQGVLEIYAYGIGKEAIFRDRPQWQPPVQQSPRGMAMLLSTLRVVASLAQEMHSRPAAYDAVLHMFDLLSGLQPAVRSLYILTQGKTPTSQECAALSHSIFHILEAFMPTELVGQDQKRLFEGARLLFGLILEKAKTVKLPGQQLATEHADHPYLRALDTVKDLRDTQTLESILFAVNTQLGLVERGCYDAVAPGAVLADSSLMPQLVRADGDPLKSRLPY